MLKILYIYIYIFFLSIVLSIFFLSHSPSNFTKIKLSVKLINCLQNLHYHPNTKTYSLNKQRLIVNSPSKQRLIVQVNAWGQIFHNVHKMTYAMGETRIQNSRI